MNAFNPIFIYSVTDLLTDFIDLLIPCSRVLLEKLTCTQSRNSPHFMEAEGSLPHSQVPATCPYPEPARSSPCPHIPLPEDPSQYSPCSNILPSTPVSHLSFSCPGVSLNSRLHHSCQILLPVRPYLTISTLIAQSYEPRRSHRMRNYVTDIATCNRHKYNRRCTATATSFRSLWVTGTHTYIHTYIHTYMTKALYEISRTYRKDRSPAGYRQAPGICNCQDS